MADLFASGRIVDLILLLVAVEVAALPWLLRRTGAPVRLACLLPNIAAGGALLLALRFALADSPWPWIGAALFTALLCHLLDLGMRLEN